jgi:hypothetical protein
MPEAEGATEDTSAKERPVRRIPRSYLQLANFARSEIRSTGSWSAPSEGSPGRWF